jgi:glycosyltransferase involved in cell wall biosynthesis
VIHNGVDLQRFPIDRSARREGPVRALCVARLVEQKGIEYLIEAVAHLRGTVALECRIIGGRGSISYDLELRKILRRLALSDSVTIEGARSFDDVQAAYRWSDIVVLPAVVAADGRRDVTPNVLIEAMAAVRPVIGTPVAGIPELIEDEVTGLLVEPRDAIALSGAIARLATDEQLRVRMGAAGRRRVEDLFDIEKNIRSFAALFRGEVAP